MPLGDFLRDHVRAGDAGAYAFLEEHGYCVFAGVLAPDEVERATDLFWDLVEGAPPVDARGEPDPRLPPISRNDPDTWRWSANPINGVLGVAGVGQRRSRP